MRTRLNNLFGEKSTETITSESEKPKELTKDQKFLQTVNREAHQKHYDFLLDKKFGTEDSEEKKKYKSDGKGLTPSPESLAFEAKAKLAAAKKLVDEGKGPDDPKILKKLVSDATEKQNLADNPARVKSGMAIAAIGLLAAIAGLAILTALTFTGGGFGALFIAGVALAYGGIGVTGAGAAIEGGPAVLDGRKAGQAFDKDLTNGKSQSEALGNAMDKLGIKQIETKQPDKVEEKAKEQPLTKQQEQGKDKKTQESVENQQILNPPPPPSTKSAPQSEQKYNPITPEILAQAKDALKKVDSKDNGYDKSDAARLLAAQTQFKADKATANTK